MNTSRNAKSFISKLVAGWSVWELRRRPILAFLYLLLFLYLSWRPAPWVITERTSFVFLITLLAAAACGFFCRRLAEGILSYGKEFKGPPGYRLLRLRSLIIRQYGPAAFVGLVVTPVTCGVGLSLLHDGHANYPPIWMMVLSLILLHWLFFAIAMYRQLDNEARPLKWLINAAVFPVRYLVWGVPIIYLFLAMHAASQLVPEWVLSRANVASRDLLEWSIIGPVILYLLNPVFVLRHVFIVEDGGNITATCIFIGVTAALNLLVGARVYWLLFHNLEQRCVEFFIAKQKIRAATIAGALAAKSKTTAKAALPTGWPARVTADDFVLPQAKSAEVFIADRILPWSVPMLLVRGFLALIFFAAVPVVGSAMALLAFFVWIMLTTDHVIPTNRLAYATPQSVWRVLGIYLSRRTGIYWVGDMAISCYLAVLYPDDLLQVGILVLLVFTLRLNMLLIQLHHRLQTHLSHVMEAVFAQALALVVGVLIMMRLATGTWGGSESHENFVYGATAVVVLVAGWVAGVTWYKLRTIYNNLMQVVPENDITPA